MYEGDGRIRTIKCEGITVRTSGEREWVECLECKFDGLVHESYVNVWLLMSCNHMVSL